MNLILNLHFYSIIIKYNIDLNVFFCQIYIELTDYIHILYNYNTN
jgi:hypothetical protein